MPRGYDWPTEGHGDTKVSLTRSGIEDLFKDLSPEHAGELKRVAHELRMGQRSVTFPEVPGRGAGGHAAASRSNPGTRGEIGNIMGGLSPRRRLIANWFRAIIDSPRGMAFHCAQDETVKRVLGEAGQSEGGYLIPPGFVDELVQDQMPLNMLLPWVRTIPVSQPKGTLPLTAANPMMFWGTENTTISEGDPAFADVQWDVQRLNSMVQLSRELGDDTSIVDFVMQLFMKCIVSERDRVIAVGSGSGQPEGLYSAAGIYDTGITSLNFETMVALKYSIDLRYHNSRSFRWHMNQRVLQTIMQITDTLGRPIFSSPTAGAPGLILGTEYSVSPAFPDSYIGIGDLSYYIWFDRQQVTVEQTTEGGTAFQNHQRWIKIISRVDGKAAIPPTPPLARTTVLTGIS